MQRRRANRRRLWLVWGFAKTASKQRCEEKTIGKTASPNCFLNLRFSPKRRMCACWYRSSGVLCPQLRPQTLEPLLPHAMGDCGVSYSVCKETVSTSCDMQAAHTHTHKHSDCIKHNNWSTLPTSALPRPVRHSVVVDGVHPDADQEKGRQALF